jgi:hypothetical protein
MARMTPAFPAVGNRLQPQQGPPRVERRAQGARRCLPTPGTSLSTINRLVGSACVQASAQSSVEAGCGAHH